MARKYGFCKGGNIKLGYMLTFSKLYGSREIFVEKLNTYIKGTCGCHCSGCENDCYVKSMYRYGSVIYNHAKNTVGIRTEIGKVFSDLDSQLTKMKKHRDCDIRIHPSGELESAHEFEMWCTLANKHPEHTFYIYTKNYYAVIPALLKNIVPENFIILFSVWGNQGIKEYKAFSHRKNVKCFVYVDDTYSKAWYEKNHFQLQTQCKAYNEAGKLDHAVTCDICKKCNRVNSMKVIYCYSH